MPPAKPPAMPAEAGPDQAGRISSGRISDPEDDLRRLLTASGAASSDYDLNPGIQLAAIAAPAPAYAAPVALPAPTAAAAAPAASEDPTQHPGAVTSPMVGTVYLAAEPGASAFVTIGAQVKEGQTLLIIEAMKTMNHIPAPKSGTVKRILVDDAAPVEYGAPLMIIE